MFAGELLCLIPYFLLKVRLLSHMLPARRATVRDVA